MAFFDTVSKLLLLLAHRPKFLLLCTLYLGLDALVELEVSSNSLLSFKLHQVLLHDLLGILDLILQACLLGESHTELGELEEDLEVREEVNHISSIGRVTDSLEEVTLITFGIHVNALGHILEPLAITIHRRALLNLLAVDDITREDIFTILSKACTSVVEDHHADCVEDSASRVAYAALVSCEDLLDLLDVVSVDNLDELGLRLAHTLDELLEVTKLLRVGGRISLGILVRSLEALFLSVGTLELLSDLAS